MRQESIRPLFVDCIPDHLDDGVLYISERYRTATHKCCCGCGQEVVTPLTPADWILRKDGATVTLHPSIGNWGFPCRSHYLIQRNRVVWAAAMSNRQIAQVRRRDLAAKDAYAAAVNHRKDLAQGQDAIQAAGEHGGADTLMTAFWKALLRFLRL